MQLISIAGIVPESIVDGPGLRYVVFVQGCPHHCSGCHNPETWPFTTAKQVDPAWIMNQVRKNPLVKGVTFSGGEPFCQPYPLMLLANMLHKEHYHVMAYTGYTYDQLLNFYNLRLLQTLDLLVDGPFIESQKSLDLQFRGSKNQRIIDVPASLKAGKVILADLPNWRN